MTTTTLPRAVVEQALEALEAFMEDSPRPYDAIRGQAAITAFRAALAQPVPHGCHVDLDHGMKPDGCVLDDGRPENCIYAKRLLREGKDKTSCEYWKPIEVQR